jgi:hypothetical protein
MLSYNPSGVISITTFNISLDFILLRLLPVAVIAAYQQTGMLTTTIQFIVSLIAVCLTCTSAL